MKYSTHSISSSLDKSSSSTAFSEQFVHPTHRHISLQRFVAFLEDHLKFVQPLLHLQSQSFSNTSGAHILSIHTTAILPFSSIFQPWLENDHTHSANQRREFSCSIFHKLSGITSSGGGFEAQGN